ncbi:mRNA 3'-end processing factor [Agrobacterium tumefaciens]|uniref:catechol 1,2-dioxygenase n=1 Tax=Agrobacterium tumefaciens TaxID=358 RepID=A0A0D0KLK6_AGRTU|nr:MULTISPECIES: catechol 1,2-dioxygenase [unclassified Rhizobium]KIQ00342.1 mRNA 3'-end processing factor [Agrobacterium tumefaciens]MBD8687722.1 catechol 1,2-dioxygenase [Rhizobium sp. CFBP 13644]MBD8692176.1 catechol 1,2-dioxygenase [Rhizobium sp. CFBP 13717]
MAKGLIEREVIAALARRASGIDEEGGDGRLKEIMNRLLADLFQAIDDLDISMNEVWSAVAYIGAAGRSNELGLIAPGIGLEHFLDLRLDEEERRAGLAGGTPRTIEGPLYIAGAPLCQHFARLDDGSDKGEVLFMNGQVRDQNGKPVAGAVVDVWHADTRGNYSHFDPQQAPYNLRRRIVTDDEGRYRFRSIMPSGYSTPPGGNTEKLLFAIGRHGNRPAHIHFFVEAPGHRHLTTQINIEGDPYLFDDFAFGTRDDLIPPVERVSDPKAMADNQVQEPFATIEFDFVLMPAVEGVVGTIVDRERAQAA